MTRTRGLLLAGLLLALVLAGGVSYYASGSPDGLERVAADKGFGDTAEDHGLADSPVADYSVRGVEDERLSGGLAGVLGVVATLAVGGVLFRVVRGRGRGEGRPEDEPAGSGPGSTARR
nr:cobalt/nickel transport system permease protein [uncultured bacterium]